MIYLLLTLLCSTCLMLVFKLIAKFNLSTFPVVVINYMVCAMLGILLHGKAPSLTELFSRSWLPFALVLGSLFISVFYLVGVSTRLNGITPAAIAFKLSLAIPVCAAFFLYNESLGVVKIAGIVLSIPAIYLSSKTEENSIQISKHKYAFVLPVIVFLGSGIVDALFNFVQRNHLEDHDKNIFLISLFGTASLIGGAILLINLLQGKLKITLGVVLMGIILGLPNYGSVYFMYKTLEFSGMESSVIFPVNNIGIIILSSFLAFILFKEKLSRINFIGVIIAIISIALITRSV